MRLPFFIINGRVPRKLDYGRNIQEYTYQHIKSSLATNMSIENEYYEGDELYITINVEE